MDYKEDDDCDWIECDYCDTWFHYTCTDLPVLDCAQDEQDFTCMDCQRKGYPSHNE